ncbi:Protein zwilch-like protein [Plecturocebus cupreus]
MGKNFVIYPSDKELISRIYKELKQIYKKKTSLFKNFSELTLNGSLEERISFTNLVTCSHVHFKRSIRRTAVMRTQREQTKEPPHLNDVVCCLVQAGATELQARDSKQDHSIHKKWQGVPCSPTWRGLAYLRITERDPVLHAVPKGFKAQVGIVSEVVGHAHILPPAVFDLQQL